MPNDKVDLNQDELVKAEMERRESLQDAKLKKTEKTESTEPIDSENKSLGKVDLSNKTNRSSTSVGQEKLQEDFDRRKKGIELYLSSLPTKGRFYPSNTKIFINSATVDAIKDYSLMDDTDPLDINEKLNSILRECSTVQFGGRIRSFKDITEDDKMFIVLSIKELTFPQGRNKLSLNHICHKCEHENHFELRSENLRFFEENKKLAKYYDPIERCFIVETKDFGEIRLTPPTIGTMLKITEFAQTKQQERKKIDRAFLQILPYLKIDYAQLNNDTIFEKLTEMVGWHRDKFILVNKLVDWLKENIKQTLVYNCDNKMCGAELEVETRVEGGMKAFFLTNDIDDQLV